MTRDDIKRVIASFVAATRRSEQAGFDVVEIHAAHGYLISSFLSATSNHRTDEYGMIRNVTLTSLCIIYISART